MRDRQPEPVELWRSWVKGYKEGASDQREDEIWIRSAIRPLMQAYVAGYSYGRRALFQAKDIAANLYDYNRGKGLISR